MSSLLNFPLRRISGLIVLMFGLISLYAQDNLTVKGKITHADDDSPLAGVTVVLQGTNTGALSNDQGEYTLSVPANGSVLVFSYYGYQKQEVPVTGAQMDIQLSEDISSLEEVVVVGYGTQQKRFVTGAISNVGADEIADVPNISVQSSLQGRAAGVQVTTSDGMAGAPVLIRVRGTSSVAASSEPLYVVDGVPIISGNYSVNNAANWNLATANETNALAQLNPADIESIQILKDASAAAIYGARGANGVVIITTKQGKAGKTKFDLGYYAGLSKETNRIEMLDGPTYLSLAKEAWANSGRDTSNDFEQMWSQLLPQGLTKEVAEQTDTDWIDLMLQRGFMQEANMSASGGNDKTKFFVGGTYRDEEGIFVGNAFERFNARVNLDHKANNFLSFGARTAFTLINNDRIPISWAGGLGRAQSVALPFYPIYNEDRTYFNPTTGVNPVAELAETEMTAQSFSVLGNVYAQVNFTPNLFWRNDFGLNNIYRDEFFYRSKVIRNPMAISTSSQSQTYNWTGSSVLSYLLDLGNHRMELMAGMNAQKTSFNANILTGEGFANPALKLPENASIQTGSQSISEYSFLSFFGRVNYRFKDRYLASVSVRRDGSSRFGPEKRWGFFPAISVGYLLSEEEFIKKIEAISYLKLRVGYGITGNAEIGNYGHIGSFGTSNYVNNAGIVITNLDNPGLGWESSNQLDIGLDIGFLEGRIQGTIDAYQKNTEELLLNVAVSALTGAETATVNIGALKNEGIELDITSYNTIGKFKWSTQVNVSLNRNEVTELAPNITFTGLFGGGSIIEVGYPVGVRRLVRYAGVAESDMELMVTDPETMEQMAIQVQGGDPLYLNQFDEVTNIYDPRDIQFVGQAYPTWTGGITNNFEYKGFDLSFLFSYAFGHDLENSEQQNQFAPFGYGWNSWASFEDRWTTDGQQTDVPRNVWLSPLRGQTSTRFLYDADYVRLRDITIGYTLPPTVLAKLKLSQLRIFVKGTNAWTWTKYPGWDPEYNRDGADSDNYGKSWLPSPQAKAVTAGINLSF